MDKFKVKVSLIMSICDRGGALLSSTSCISTARSMLVHVSI